VSFFYVCLSVLRQSVTSTMMSSQPVHDVNSLGAISK